MTLTRDARIALGVLLGAWLLKYLKPIATVSTDWDWRLPSTSYPPAVQQFATAIAKAEGFYVRNSVPARAHNPGSLKVPGWAGPVLGDGISAFDSDGQGWTALYRQLQLIVNGESAIYSLDMTIADMARRWTATTTEQGAWATNVARALGADVNDPLWKVLV